jgi:catechol 2,3-dioxygenase-like lactoylglutathione lyase family enzyme
MALLRMDNIGIVFEDLDGAIDFFAELGLELEGRMVVEGEWAGRVVGIEGMRCEIAMMKTPDGHGKLELSRFLQPAVITPEPRNAPQNTLGLRRIMFAVDDIRDTVARLQTRGAQLVGDIVDYENIYRLCFLRGPEGILIALAEQIG